MLILLRPIFLFWFKIKTSSGVPKTRSKHWLKQNNFIIIAYLIIKNEREWATEPKIDGLIIFFVTKSISFTNNIEEKYEKIVFLLEWPYF